jgi:N-methylhydantoinase B/oxoprolinase/acetone carboxylase alpha subunit
VRESGSYLSPAEKQRRYGALRNTGGGGYGLPRRRAIEKIEHDLREGYISTQEAQHAYGYGSSRQA